MDQPNTEINNNLVIPASHSDHLKAMLQSLQEVWDQGNSDVSSFDAAFKENLLLRIKDIGTSNIWFKMNLGPIIWFDKFFDTTDKTPEDFVSAVLKSLDYTFNPDTKYVYLLGSVKVHKKEFLSKYPDSKSVKSKFRRFLNQLFKQKKYSLIVCFEDDKKDWDTLASRREAYDKDHPIHRTQGEEIKEIS